MSLSKLNIICFGMGAIGTYIGGSLAASGAHVVFIEKTKNIDEARKNGIHLSVGDREIRLTDINVTSSLSEALSFQKPDVALLAVKSYDTVSVMDSITGFENYFPPILCLQNGVENETLIAKKLGEEKVISGTITTAVGRTGLGIVKLERLRGVGIETGHPLSHTIIDWFNNSGLKAKGYSSRLDMKWSKLLTNLLANASSAILNWTAGQVYSNAITYGIEVEQIREALAVMKALRIHLINLPGTPAVALMTALKVLPTVISQKLVAIPLAKGRGAKMPSFHVDLYSGKTVSEVSFLNGAVSRFGKMVNVPTPVNQKLTLLLEEIASGVIQKNEFAYQPEKLDNWIKDTL